MRDDEVREAKKAYSEVKALRCGCITWNVGGADPPTGLKQLFSQDADLYFVGLQEIDSSAGALLVDDGVQKAKWTQALIDAVGPDYVMRKVVHLVGLLSLLFVRKVFERIVSNVDSAHASCGVFGILGNKGATAIRLSMYDTQVVVVNAHLAANVDQLSRRSWDIGELRRKIRFAMDDSVLSSHDAVILWMGDLNYRLSTSRDDCLALLACGKLEPLLATDQLRQEMEGSRVFEGFLEGMIGFRPSYKFDIGSNEYDTSEKHRCPAWTDRVLWRVGMEEGVDCLGYTSIESFVSSDHKPVVATLQVQALSIIEEAYAKYRLEAARSTDRLQNERQPRIQLSSSNLEMGRVGYGRRYARSVKIVNIGTTETLINVSHPSAPPWVKHATLGKSSLQPGEQTVLSVVVFVGSNCVSQLTMTTGKPVLSTCVVIGVDQGSHHFVMLTGVFERTCLGMSLDMLSRCQTPVRDLVDLDFDKNLSRIPYELFTLTEFCRMHTTTYIPSKSIFHHERTFLYILNLLNNRGAIEYEELESTAVSGYNIVDGVYYALFELLRVLPEPVIPIEFHDRCLSSPLDDAQSVGVISSL